MTTEKKTGLHIRTDKATGTRLFRVYENGEPIGGKNPSDGGGFERRGDAEALIIQVERRRAEKAKRREAEQPTEAQEGDGASQEGDDA